MYESFYGLREKPFNLTPDPKFLYLSKKHKEAFAHLLYGIRNRSGFVEITGEVGTGKTTICRTLLEQVGPEVEIAFIFNPYLSATELLKAVNDDFGIQSSAVTKKELIDELNAHLLERRKEGKNCVLLIDEAQNLSAPVLEQIRLLSNLETDTEKLLQIILVGQPELKENLSTSELRQLNQRITARYHLKSLDYDEVVQYVAHRITKAGGRGKVRFTAGALKEIYRYSGGVPRLINSVCDRALLIGYTQEKKQIRSAIIKSAVKEIEGEKVKVRRREAARVLPGIRAVVYMAAVILVLVGVGYYGFIVVPDILHSKAAVMPAPRPEPVQIPVPVESKTDETEQDFMDFIRSLDYRASKRTAAARLAMCWAANPEELTGLSQSGVIDFSEAARVAGLRWSSVRSDITRVKRVGLPCILELFLPGDENPVFICAERLEHMDAKDVVTVSNGTDPAQRFPFELIEKYWFGRTHYFWRDFEKVPEILTKNSAGDTVKWLQTQLQEAGTYAGEITGTYGQETVRAVTEFQRKYGIDDDGVAGPNTRMVIYAALAKYQTPKLVSEAMAPREGA